MSVELLSITRTLLLITDSSQRWLFCRSKYSHWTIDQIVNLPYLPTQSVTYSELTYSISNLHEENWILFTSGPVSAGLFWPSTQLNIAPWGRDAFPYHAHRITIRSTYQEEDLLSGWTGNFGQRQSYFATISSDSYYITTTATITKTCPSKPLNWCQLAKWLSRKGVTWTTLFIVPQQAYGYHNPTDFNLWFKRQLSTLNIVFLIS